MKRTHLASTLALVAGAAALVATIAACGGANIDRGIGIGVDPAVPAAAGSCCSGTYAAMDEVPVEGGELRLVDIKVDLDVDVTVDGDGGRAANDATPQKIIAFPLQHTDVKVKVAEMMAVYTVTQTFSNPFDQPIDAVYVFPLGDESAVSGFSMTIGERTVIGEIQRREQARQTYENARSSGHTAALVEQEKANVFAQRIANIAPHETIKVRFDYTELLDYADGQYEIVFPLVVGPRYLPETAVGRRPVGSHAAGRSGRPGVTSVPYLADNRDASKVSFTAEIDAGVPIHGVDSPSHDIESVDVSPTRMNVTLHGKDEIPNRDLIVKYRVAGPQTMVGLMSHRTDNDGAFVLVVQPKAEYKTGDIAPREVMLVIDRSGSMEGVPLEQAKAVASGILDTLTYRDTFNILTFADTVETMSTSPVGGDAAGVRRGHEFLASFASGGGTEMQQGLVQSLADEPGSDRIRIVYLLSDGFVGNDDVVLGAARGALAHNRIYPVGMGSSVNRALLNQLADVGRGFPSYLTPSEKAATLVPTLVRRSAYPYLTNVTIDWNGLDVSAITPSKIADVYAGLPLIVSGRYGKPGAARITIRGFAAGREVSIPLDVTLAARLDNPPVASLWARRRIQALMIANPEGLSIPAANEIAEIGMRYHMVTEETSFVAVDRTRVVQPGGATKLVEQPAAIPEGVNIDSALGEASAPAYQASNSYSSSSSSSSSGDWGGGGGGYGGGGGDVDPLTLLIALALLPLAFGLRRFRRRA
jgi:Ca-activated chloride channel family protein